VWQTDGDFNTRSTRRDVRLEPTKKCSLAALVAFVVKLAAVTLAPAADTIEELLQQDEASGQNDVLRPDLNAQVSKASETATVPLRFAVGHTQSLRT
jgi:hypothetical protein